MKLSPREMEAYRLLLTGKHAKECAADMGVTLGTFKVYARWVFIKHGVKDRIGLMAQARNSAIIDAM